MMDHLFHRRGFLGLALGLLICGGGHALAQSLSTTGPSNAFIPADPIPPSQTTVVWVSIDGFRHDYIERFHPPALSKLYQQGAFTTHETPIFPSLTFPNHIAQVTGVGVDVMGVPMNNWYDESTGKSYSFPDESSLLRAEPIWITATRQGVRTAVIDWPMSDNEIGPIRAAAYDNAFDNDETDRERLDRIIMRLNADHDAQLFRLIMGYMSQVDHAGHAAPQNSPRIAEAVMNADQDVQHFVDGVLAWFNKTHGPDQELVIIFSTDHGMTSVKEQVSLDRLIGAELVKDIKISTSGPMATIHTNDAPADRADQIVQRLRPYEFLDVWKSADVPPEKHYRDPTRIGQVVVMLKPGYAWSRNRLATTLPVPHESGGNHGYDPLNFPDMQGSAVIWRLRHPIGGVDLGTMQNTQWDATVCALLGIKPPAVANPQAVVTLP